LLSEITWQCPGDGDYIIVVDGYSANTGPYDLAYTGTECEAVPTEEASWGSVKTLYR
jgi:hypothetical protein